MGHDWDVVVAGAGVAGVSVAAALREFGDRRVLVVEPGLDNTKRLAGELIHPPGASDLAALGLLDPLEQFGSQRVRGQDFEFPLPRVEQPGEDFKRRPVQVVDRRHEQGPDPVGRPARRRVGPVLGRLLDVGRRGSAALQLAAAACEDEDQSDGVEPHAAHPMLERRLFQGGTPRFRLIVRARSL